MTTYLLISGIIVGIYLLAVIIAMCIAFRMCRDDELIGGILAAIFWPFTLIYLVVCS